MAKPKIPELPQAAEGAQKRVTHSLQVNLDGMPVDELLELRTLIDQKLPARQLKDIDLEQELVLQLLATQELQRKVLKDDEAPANQMAQVSNAVQAALQNLVKLQGEVFKSERLKRLETILLECIKDLPHEVQDQFLTLYELRLEGL
jgi:hypothetical protein